MYTANELCKSAQLSNGLHPLASHHIERCNQHLSKDAWVRGVGIEPCKELWALPVSDTCKGTCQSLAATHFDIIAEHVLSAGQGALTQTAEHVLSAGQGACAVAHRLTDLA